MTDRYPIGPARTFENNQIYRPSDNCRSFIAYNVSTNSIMYIASMPVEPGRSFSVDVYPNERISGTWKIEGTTDQTLMILELA